MSERFCAEVLTRRCHRRVRTAGLILLLQGLCALDIMQALGAAVCRGHNAAAGFLLALGAAGSCWFLALR